MLFILVAWLVPAGPANRSAHADTAAATAELLPDTPSAMSKHAPGRFSAMTVKVNQTESLTDQAVKVSWTGAFPTQDVHAGMVQIMQCWGDPAAGPAPEQCEYGIRPAGEDVNYFTRSFQSPATGLFDPLEHRPVTSVGEQFVPFHAVDGTVVTTYTNPYFDVATSNQISRGRTGNDGRGQDIFDVATNLDAPGLGCGTAAQAAGGASVDVQCFLVVVPRDDLEVDGQRFDAVRPGATFVQASLISSPLSASNWVNRVVFPLGFRPLKPACSGAQESALVRGTQFAALAAASWLPALCAAGGTDFSYVSLPGEQVRIDVLAGPSEDAGLQVATRGSDRFPASLVDAPVALNGLGIAFNVTGVFDRARFTHLDPVTHHIVDTTADDPAAVAAATHDGETLSTLNLTPRLLAKLLTSSYRYATSISGSATQASPTVAASNPAFIYQDPDFREVNPELKYFNFAIFDLLIDFGRQDQAAAMWTYIANDADAKVFLSGVADPWGMVMNTAFSGLTVPLDNFPKSDSYCENIVVDRDRPKSCVLAQHAYALNMHDIAARVARGAGNGVLWDTTAQPHRFKSVPPQTEGTSTLAGITTTDEAARYGLPMASLRNAAGKFVSPSPSTLLAGLSHMQPGSFPSILEAHDSAADPDAYPLPMLSYAMANPSGMSHAAGQAAASFIRYAATSGQVQAPGNPPGTLPDGYVPLPEAMRDQALDAADSIAYLAGKADPTASPSPSVRPSGSPSAIRPSTPSVTARPNPTVAGAVTRTTPLPVVSAAPVVAPSQPDRSASPTPTPTGSSAPSITPGPEESATAAATPSTRPQPSSRPNAGAARPSMARRVPSINPSLHPSTGVTTTPAPSATPPGAAVNVEPVSAVTPGTRIGTVRFVFVIVLAAGVLAALAGPGLWGFGLRRRR